MRRRHAKKRNVSLFFSLCSRCPLWLSPFCRKLSIRSRVLSFGPRPTWERIMPAARLVFVAVIALLVSSFAHASPGRLVVHEWGTFTSLQDEAGRTLSYINTDDEPVPGFVHGLGRGNKGLFILPTEMPPPLAQGAPVGHPQITMRLETPVTYFHLPAGM